jgi:peptidoglycan/LPS O-acetylase OafA/YrhL
MPTLEPPRQRGYLPALDGLRAVAILGVLAFHLDVPGAALGWAGVELFFVLSGFLITRILLASRESPSYFRDFYIRRALRIFPIYYLFVMFAARAAPAWHIAPGPALPYYLTYTQNFVQVATRFRAGLPLTEHTWTLAIEEQFYLAWPLVIFFAAGKRLWAVLGALFAGGLAFRLWAALSSSNPYLTIGLVFGQVDALAAGAMIAVFLSSSPSEASVLRLSKAALAVGALGVLGLVWRSGYGAFSRTVVWAPLPLNAALVTFLSLFFGGLVLLAATGHPLAVALLDRAPLKAIGRVSYGVYLYHPVVLRAVWFALSGVRWYGIPITRYPIGLLLYGVLGICASLGAAWLSWSLLEKRCLALKDRFTKSRRDFTGKALADGPK